MKQDIKDNILITLFTLGLIMFIPIIFYLFFGYMNWLFGDPWNLFQINNLKV